MSKLDELIAELCPDGVEYRKLKDVTEMQRGTSLTKKNATEGIYPVISGGTEPAFYCDSYNRENETITVAGSGVGAGYVQYWNEPIFVCDAFSIKGKEGNLTKYIYYCLSNMQDKIFATKTGGGIPHVYISSIENFVIPLPPLPVQQEIVRILDNFTELKAELKAELTARRKQYEYYRDLLLTFGDEVEWKTLGEIGKLIRGSGLLKSDFVEEGFPCIHYGQIHTYYGTSATETISFVSVDKSKKLKKAKKGDVLIAGVSENVEDVCKPLAWLGGDICISGDMFAFRHNQNTKYITYLLQTTDFSRYKEKFAHGAKVTRLRQDKLLAYKIPVPPLEEQERIVAILDRFDALCNDLTSGIPAEIEARQKQYEYYRDKLLSFKEVTA